MALEDMVVVWPAKETKNGGQQVQVTVEDTPGTKALRALLGIEPGESFYVMWGHSNPRAPWFKVMRTVPDGDTPPPTKDTGGGMDDVPF